jgi:hypothetical protein
MNTAFVNVTHVLRGPNENTANTLNMACKSATFTALQRTTMCRGTAVAQWLRCYATYRNVAGSIPASVSGIFIDIKSFLSHYGPGVDSAFNRNEYQEYFLVVKAAGA